MENTKVNVTFSDEQNELIVRHGQALAQIKPVPLNIKGDIHAPSEFVKKRKTTMNALETHVIVDREKGEIKLVTGDHDELADTITGNLIIDPKFLDFQILSGKDWELEALGKFLKKNRCFFIDRNDNVRLVAELRNFKGKVQTEIEKLQDDRGNKRHLVEKKVMGNVPEEFRLKMPLFKGFPAETFIVTIGLESRDSRVVAWLESIQAEEMIETQRDAIIQEVCKELEDYVVIYK